LSVLSDTFRECGDEFGAEWAGTITLADGAAYRDVVGGEGEKLWDLQWCQRSSKYAEESSGANLLAELCELGKAPQIQ
jgi:hypothetical protein